MFFFERTEKGNIKFILCYSMIWVYFKYTLFCVGLKPNVKIDVMANVKYLF